MKPVLWTELVVLEQFVNHKMWGVQTIAESTEVLTFVQVDGTPSEIKGFKSTDWFINLSSE